MRKKLAKKRDIDKSYGDRKNFSKLDDTDAEPAIGIRDYAYPPFPKDVH